MAGQRGKRPTGGSVSYPRSAPRALAACRLGERESGGPGMRPLGVPMIGWVWAGGTLAIGQAGFPSPKPSDWPRLRRVRSAQREGDDAVNWLCRMYWRKRPEHAERSGERIEALRGCQQRSATGHAARPSAVRLDAFSAARRPARGSLANEKPRTTEGPCGALGDAMRLPPASPGAGQPQGRSGGRASGGGRPLGRAGSSIPRSGRTSPQTGIRRRLAETGRRSERAGRH